VNVLFFLQPEEMTPSHESLRITVGNDIYKDQRPRSPLSDNNNIIFKWEPNYLSVLKMKKLEAHV
jgi:hypothetical protein